MKLDRANLIEVVIKALADGGRCSRSQEEPADVTDEEALPVLLEAISSGGTGILAALKLSAETLAFLRRVSWLRAFASQQLTQVSSDTASDSEAGGSSATSPAAHTSGGGQMAAAAAAAVQEVGPELERKLREAAALPELSDRALAASAGTWMAPHIRQLRSLAQVQRVDWLSIFRSVMPPHTHTPDHFLTPLPGSPPHALVEALSPPCAFVETV